MYEVPSNILSSQKSQVPSTVQSPLMLETNVHSAARQKMSSDQKTPSDIKRKIQLLLRDASSFEIIATLNDAALRIQRWYRVVKKAEEKRGRPSLKLPALRQAPSLNPNNIGPSSFS